MTYISAVETVGVEQSGSKETVNVAPESEEDITLGSGKDISSLVDDPDSLEVENSICSDFHIRLGRFTKVSLFKQEENQCKNGTSMNVLWV